MSRYIIDVTQLVHWQGQLTGIPRVMQELAVRFPSKASKEVVFASWVKEVQSMCEVDLEKTLAMRGKGIEYVKESSSQVRTIVLEAPIEPTRISMTRHLKIITNKTLQKAGVGNSAPILRLKKSLHDKKSQTYKKVRPMVNDLLFIPAGEWWDSNFIHLVKQYHKKGVKIVQVSHDMLPVVTPQFAGHATESLSCYNAQIIPICSLVLAVSESTKKDLTKWLESKELQVPKIEVFRLGEDFHVAQPKRPDDILFNESGLRGNDYILCVGTIEARKNHALLYYTYKLAKSKGIHLPKLVMVGRRGWKTEDIYEYLTNDPDTKQDLLPMHDISDEELSWLYSNCLFTVYPSFYEGWGMPIAESIMRGAPCLSSNTSSMKEVAPGYANYFNPNSTDECLDGIIKMLVPEHLAKVREKIKFFESTSWDDSFKQVLDKMEKI